MQNSCSNRSRKEQKDKSLRHAEKHTTDIVTCPEDGYFSYEASHTQLNFPLLHEKLIGQSFEPCWSLPHHLDI